MSTFTVQNLMYNGNIVGKYIVVFKDQYELKLVSQEYTGSKRTVSQYCNAIEGSVAGINGGLFSLSTYLNSKPTVIGLGRDIYGKTIGTVGYQQPSICFDSGGLHSDNADYDTLSNYDWFRTNAYYCFLRDGAEVNDIDTNYTGAALLDNPDTRSMIGMNSTAYILAVTTASLTRHDQAHIMQGLGCTEGFNLDGGGSRQLVVNGTMVAGDSTERSVTDAIVVPKKFRMHFYGSSGRIRDDIPNGNTQIIIPNNSYIEVANLYSWTASDGYRWGWGTYAGVTGYFQYDPAVMHPVGKVPHNWYRMVLTGSAAAIRKSVLGVVETVVPNGQNITIEEFLPSLAADGYYWCKGSWGNHRGYFQFDPEVMYPTDD